MQCREGSHAEPDDVSLVDSKMFEHRRDVVGRTVLSVRRIILGHVGGGIAARVEGDASILPREPSDLAFPFAVVGAELVHEHDRIAGSGFLEVESYSR